MTMMMMIMMLRKRRLKQIGFGVFHEKSKEEEEEKEWVDGIFGCKKKNKSRRKVRLRRSCRKKCLTIKSTRISNLREDW